MKKITDSKGLIKIKNFQSVKDTVKRMKRNATGWEKTFAEDISDNGLLSKIYKELLKLNSKKTNNSNNGPKTLTDISLKKIYRNGNKHIKRAPHLCHQGNES